MKTASGIALVIFLLAVSAHRLPAPISEESPTPTATPVPEIPQKAQELLGTSKPSPASTNVPNSSSVLAWPGEAFPETRIRRLKAEDVTGWDAEKLRYAINEMYARGGYDFRTPEIKQIFMRLSWYRERLVNDRSQDEAYAHLSPLERTNLEFLQGIRRGKQYQ